jgi:acetyl esterase/lipase
MAASLDLVNQAFVSELSKGPPLYEKTPAEARQILEDVQKHTPAPDITQEELDVPYESYNVKTIIFRPKNASGNLPTIFYTHGGGWILGRYGLSIDLNPDRNNSSNPAPLSMVL